MVELPAPCANVAVLPLTGWLFASLSVTVIVEVATPSAASHVAVALTVDVPALTGPTVKFTVAVWVTVTESVVSVAVYVTDSTTVSFTVKLACPLASVAALAGEIVELPGPCASVTVLPLTGLSFTSLCVIVIVDVQVPFAITDVGLALTMECAALTAPAVALTDGCGVIGWALPLLPALELVVNCALPAVVGAVTPLYVSLKASPPALQVMPTVIVHGPPPATEGVPGAHDVPALFATVMLPAPPAVVGCVHPEGTTTVTIDPV